MTMSIKQGLILMVLITCSKVAISQDWKDLDTDELFLKARTEAFDGDREVSQEMLKFILISSPDYADVRILLGRTYAWEGERKEAIIEFQLVLKKEPDYKDALNAMIDVLMWDDQYDEALSYANTALKFHPTFEDFLYKKANILKNLERFEDAGMAINQLLLINPASDRGQELRRSIKAAQLRYSTTFTSEVNLFSRTFDPAYTESLSLGRTQKWGSIIARANVSRRFNSTGLQGEVDLYPSLGAGKYAYLNYGYSASSLFPQHRFGAEVYTKLPKSFEGSIGLRHLVFAQNITIYTGTLGWYHRSMWISLRPFITPDKAAGTSISLGVTARRYFSNPSTYLELIGGFGYSPDIRRIQTANGLDANEIYTLNAQRGGVSIQKAFRYNLNASLGYTLVRQELSFDVNNFVFIHSLTGSINYKF